MIPINDQVTQRAIAALRGAFAASDRAALRSNRTQAALDYLERALGGHWSVAQFRDAVTIDNDTARWQNLNASMSAIELALAAAQAEKEP